MSSVRKTFIPNFFLHQCCQHSFHNFSAMRPKSIPHHQHTNTHTHTNKHTNTHTQTHTDTHKHTHTTRTHTQSRQCDCCDGFHRSDDYTLPRTLPNFFTGDATDEQKVARCRTYAEHSFSSKDQFLLTLPQLHFHKACPIVEVRWPRNHSDQV